jgi:VWFA-related protein
LTVEVRKGAIITVELSMFETDGGDRSGKPRAAMVVSLLLASLAASPDEGAKAPTFPTTITVVSLPVFATGPDGRAVPDLRAEDFEVFDDGKPAAVVGFRALDATDPALAEKVEEAPAARRQFLLLFDLSFTGVHGLVKARKAALDFVVHGLAPMDLAGVATYSATHGMKLLLNFTGDRAQIRRAVDSLGVLQLDRRADPLGLVYDLREVGAALADTVEPTSTNVGEDAYRWIQTLYRQAERQGYGDRVNGFIEGLGGLAQALEAVQGRKQVILLSAGFDGSLLVGNQRAAAASDSEAIIRGRIWEVGPDDRFGDPGIRSRMEKVVQTFSKSDAVVHAVDLGGLQAEGDVGHAGPSPRRPGNGQDSLSRIAELSGGRLFKDTNDVGVALGEILEMSRYYYLLAFEPTSTKPPGSFHKLKVRVKRKGLHIAHRSGYFERKPYDALTPLAREFEAAEIIAKGVDRGEIDVRALAIPFLTAEGVSTLSVVLDLDGPSLLGGREEATLGLEVYGYALDVGGRVADAVTLAATLDLAKTAPRIRHGLQCHAAFKLPAGKYDLRFLVRDAQTGRSGTVWLQVVVPSFEAAGVALLPPLFMDDVQDWLVLRTRGQTTSKEGSPFRVASEPFVPRGRPRLMNGRAERICLLAYDGGHRYDPSAAFEITPRLVDGNGTEVPLRSVQILRSVAEGSYRWFVLTVSPSGLVPGEYTLLARLHDPDSGRTSEAFQKVHVE